MGGGRKASFGEGLREKRRNVGMAEIRFSPLRAGIKAWARR